VQSGSCCCLTFLELAHRSHDAGQDSGHIRCHHRHVFAHEANRPARRIRGLRQGAPRLVIERGGGRHLVHPSESRGGISSLVMNGDSRMPVLDNVQLRDPAPPLRSPSRRLGLRSSDNAGRQQLATSPSIVSCSTPAPAAPATVRSSGGTGELSMSQVDGGLCRLRLGPTPAPAASNGDRASLSRSRAHLSKAKKCCRTATPWPIALCSAPLVGLPNQAVLTASEKERE
jgi:hypothetical protein